MPYVGLIEYLDRRLGVHTGSGPEYQYFCPVCIDRTGSESSKRKLWVNAEKGKAVCYRCGYGARSIKALFLQMNGGKILLEEKAILKGERELTEEPVNQTVMRILYGSDSEPIPLRKVHLPREVISLADEFDKPSIFARPGILYIRQRGYDLKFVEKFRVGYCATGEYAGYLVFPVWQAGEQVYFTTRFAGGQTLLKSKNPPNRQGYYGKKHCLLNFDNCVAEPVVTVAEGPFSVAAHEAGVGLMGKTISPEQLDLLDVLRRYGTGEFVVSLDADAGSEAEKVYDALADRFPRVTMLQLAHGDPDDNRSGLPALMTARKVPGLSQRVGLRLSADALKNRMKMLAAGRKQSYDRRGKQRGSR